MAALAAWIGGVRDRREAGQDGHRRTVRAWHPLTGAFPVLPHAPAVALRLLGSIVSGCLSPDLPPFLGPFVVALLAGRQLWRYGLLTAAAGAYVTFLVAEAAIVLSGRYQLRLARRRMATRRRRAHRLR